ncbi:FkbM family methyltransferase [Pannus brasiliensis]|uniref:FkbM family methyltransferase n=1 Tax=Pannus brasiliensis TaxID=1579216 RepID=UPI002FCD9C47
MVEQNISPTQVELDAKTGKLLYKPFALHLTKDKQDFLLNAKLSNKAKALKKSGNARFEISDAEELILDIDGVRLIIETGQELEIAHEIFLLGIYNFVYDKPCVAIDIGMNTGFASLFFANRQNVEVVYSYEPFKATYEQALRNIALNPRLAGKIKAFDYGVGAREETITVEYDYKVKGSVGISGIDELWKSADSSSIARAELPIKPFSEIFTGILAAHPDKDIVAKIDCEGSEYGILDSLAENGQLEKIKIIMMEWHKQGPDPLVKHLQKAGFAIFSRLPLSDNVGTLYAVRT